MDDAIIDAESMVAATAFVKSQFQCKRSFQDVLPS